MTIRNSTHSSSASCSGLLAGKHLLQAYRRRAPARRTKSAGDAAFIGRGSLPRRLAGEQAGAASDRCGATSATRMGHLWWFTKYPGTWLQQVMRGCSSNTEPLAGCAVSSTADAYPRSRSVRPTPNRTAWRGNRGGGASGAGSSLARHALRPIHIVLSTAATGRGFADAATPAAEQRIGRNSNPRPAPPEVTVLLGEGVRQTGQEYRRPSRGNPVYGRGPLTCVFAVADIDRRRGIAAGVSRGSLIGRWLDRARRGRIRLLFPVDTDTPDIVAD